MFSESKSFTRLLTVECIKLLNSAQKLLSMFSSLQGIRQMASASFGYDIEEVSQNYAKYRQTYLPELYQKILQYLDEGSKGNRRSLAVDIGCGCGHSTLPLAKHFDTVIGIDNSESQLTEAMKASAEHTNVSYQLGSAESVSSLLATNSVDLVTVGTAIHWFELRTFSEECLKILKPEGTLAVYMCDIPVYDNLEANRLISEIYKETIKNFWREGAKQVFSGYTMQWTILPHYFDQCIRDDSMSISLTNSISDVIGLVKSFPEYFFYKRDHPEHPDEVDLLPYRLKEVFNTNSTEERIVKERSSVVLLLGRKPKKFSAERNSQIF